MAAAFFATAARKGPKNTRHKRWHGHLWCAGGFPPPAACLQGDNKHSTSCRDEIATSRPAAAEKTGASSRSHWRREDSRDFCGLSRLVEQKKRKRRKVRVGHSPVHHAAVMGDLSTSVPSLPPFHRLRSVPRLCGRAHFTPPFTERSHHTRNGGFRRRTQLPRRRRRENTQVSFPTRTGRKLGPVTLVRRSPRQRPPSHWTAPPPLHPGSACWWRTAAAGSCGTAPHSWGRPSWARRRGSACS